MLYKKKESLNTCLRKNFENNNPNIFNYVIKLANIKHMLKIISGMEF